MLEALGHLSDYGTVLSCCMSLQLRSAFLDAPFSITKDEYLVVQVFTGSNSTTLS